ncbi:MAG: GntR family transcriptional regulator, partial [Ferrovum sp.]|nr:GntR family transcriptional regulator [Ferrovum sp.]
ARFAVSKSPVRDALMHLEREGLVISSPRQGYRVSPVSLSDVQDMFHLRLVLERACMERIVRLASDVQLAALDRFRHFDAAAWEGGLVAYNRAFHGLIAELSHNKRMCGQINDLIDQMERVVRVSLASIQQENPASPVAEHCQIIDALQARKAKLAARLTEQHIATAALRVNEALSRQVIAG